jgi:streptomycin 6-kinase
MSSPASTKLQRRVDDQVAAWRIVVGQLVETESSILAFGRRGEESVVLKVVRRRGDEWRSGEVLEAFGGKGVVRVLDRVEGAVLLERLQPGTNLVSMAEKGSDEQATRVLCDVIQSMSPRAPVRRDPTVQTWAQAFARYAAGGDEQIPKPLCEAAHRVYSRLCGSQSAPRLLHGDLHHYNVLLDSERGWLAVDPKGVVGELEYEVGAALRNPYERPELFADPATIKRRVDCFGRELGLDTGRILAWAFAQAVLAAIWAVEDGMIVGPDNRWIALANTIRPMVDGVDG